MRLIYGRQDMQDDRQAQTNCVLVTNGLGGYASVSAAFSVTRGDQGMLISAATAPTLRYTLVQRMREYIQREEERIWISTQDLTGGEQEDGFRHLSSLVWEGAPVWSYETGGLTVTRRLAMMPGENATAILYEIENLSREDVVFCAEPGFLGLAKGQVPEGPFTWSWDGERMELQNGDSAVYIRGNGSLKVIPEEWDELFYRGDACDGRCEKGRNLRCLQMEAVISAGERVQLELILSDRPTGYSGEQILKAYLEERKRRKRTAGFRGSIAGQLAVSASDYVVRRDSTDGSTIIAGYPFFADWGRDTMIALEGCVLAVNRIDTAREIIETFLKYERNGLVPNLFPEGEEEPRYNTVDAALLLINSVWSCCERQYDEDFLRRIFPAMKRIIEGYCRGTDHGIAMDADGLIRAGEGLDQVTWMDVYVEGILPTPRHGKPVEVNAYWYNALRIMAVLAERIGEDGSVYERMASRAKESFVRVFWMEDAGYLKDVISGSDADLQIRCNQIWAVTLPFTMLEPEQERSVVKTVYRELYTPCGLRSLSVKDPQFRPNYGGEQLQRDLAYHQGTVWVYPLGAFYRAWLKVHGYSPESLRWVRDRLDCLIPMMREGCIGQLPEIYEGLYPGASQGCFAQAWSVGEILTVLELLEKEAEYDNGLYL